MRKPPTIHIRTIKVACTEGFGGRYIFIDAMLDELSAAEAYRLSHWMTKAAAWVKAGKKVKK